MTVADEEPGLSPDGDDRIRDFWERHGGPSARPAEAGTLAEYAGWTEVYAADGYVLRCDWSRTGDRHEWKFTEKPPQGSIPPQG